MSQSTTTHATAANHGQARVAGANKPRAQAAPQLLLASQLIFNIGFFSVVPFLAVAMREEFGMGALAVGIVLGARTFAQQGLFLFGGAMADHWGPRWTMISGCIVRTAGYLLLALAADFPLFLLGAVVTGVGGALFSPALESLVAGAEERRSDQTGKGTSLFAFLVIVGELGAVLGPVLGAVLLGVGFDTALLTGAAVFTIMALVFMRFIPNARKHATSATDQPEAVPPSGLWSCLRNKRFVLFAAFYSVNLLAYNQLYFGLPLELQRSGAGLGALAAMFAYASVLTIALQWPIAKLMRRMGSKMALTLGFALQSVGFAALGVLATLPPYQAFTVLPAVVLISALSLGHMCVTPVAMALVMEFSAGRPKGAYYGLLASCGGVAVLLGNTALGPLYEHASIPAVAAAAPWLLVALLAATSAVAIRHFVPQTKAPLPDSQEIQTA